MSRRTFLSRLNQFSWAMMPFGWIFYGCWGAWIVYNDAIDGFVSAWMLIVAPTSVLMLVCAALTMEFAVADILELFARKQSQR